MNIANNDGNTPLFPAVKNGHPRAVALLLESGAVWDWRNNYTKSPMDYAKNPEVVALLEKAKREEAEAKLQAQKDEAKRIAKEAEAEEAARRHELQAISSR